MFSGIGYTTRLWAVLLSLAGAFHVRAQSPDSLAVEKLLAGKTASLQARLLDSISEKISGDDPESAIDYARRADELTAGTSTKERIYALKTLSKLMRRTGQTDLAVSYAEEGARTALFLHDTIAVFDCLLIKGGALYSTGDYKGAMNVYDNIKSLAEKAGNRIYIAKALNNTGNVYFRQQLFDQAEKFYEDSRQIYVQAGDKNGEALQLDNLALVYSNQGLFDKSEACHLKAIEVIRQMNDPVKLATSYNEMGTLFLQRERYEEAETWFRRGLQMSDTANDTEARLSALTSLSEVYTRTGRDRQAGETIDSAYRLSVSGHFTKHELSCLLARAELAEKLGNFSGALADLRRHTRLNDSLSKVNEVRELALLNARYDTEKKDRKIALLNKETEKQRLRIYIFISGFVLLLVFILLAIRSWRLRKRFSRQLEEQHAIISQKSRDMTDSIRYAQRIQESMLPSENLLRSSTAGSFIFFRPRDIVSGDFYWAEQHEGKTYIAAADCTGHGVPGALVSIAGMKLLSQAIRESGEKDTGLILTSLHRLMIRALNKDVHERESNDGMDIGLLCIDTAGGQVSFSGAGRPLFCFSTGGEQLVKGDRFSIAGTKSYDDSTRFGTTVLPLEEGMTLYLSTDGFADQFGGENGKKIQSRKLQEFLGSIHRLPMEEQAERLRRFFEDWKGPLEQVDDVLIIGIRTGGRS